MSIPPASWQPRPDESPTVRMPAPSPPRPTAAYPVDDRYRDDTWDDRHQDDGEYGKRGYGYDDRPAPVADRRPPRRRDQPRRSRRRGQLFSLLVLLGAVGMAVLLYNLVHTVVAGIDLTADDPFAGVGATLSTLGVVALCALGFFVLALIALVIARPRLLAVFAVLAALLLPVGAVLVGAWTGAEVLRQGVADDVDAAGSSVADVVRELEERGIDLGPLREWLPE